MDGKLVIPRIKYKAGYKYQLLRDYGIYTNIFPKEDIHSDFISLYTDSLLLIRYSYAWDGPSGPTFDTGNFMRGSLVHDALYQLMREGLLFIEAKKPTDLLLKRICQEDGMSKMRAWWVYNAVRKFANFAVKPEHTKPALWAP